MLRLLTDENFNQNILRGLVRSNPDLDIASAGDARLRGAPDSKFCRGRPKTIESS